jgi:hypothetical protein
MLQRNVRNGNGVVEGAANSINCIAVLVKAGIAT